LVTTTSASAFGRLYGLLKSVATRIFSRMFFRTIIASLPNRTEQEVCRFNQAEIHRSAARDGGKSSGVVKKSPTSPYAVRGIALNVVASGAAAVAPALRMQSTGS